MDSSQLPRAMWILADSLKTYNSIIKDKTAFYSFYLPVVIAVYMMGIGREKGLINTKKILLKMGESFQIQDNYLDLFGDPSVMGKIGIDIQDDKCTWLVLQCLQQASLEQCQIQQNYWQKEAKKVVQVKPVYEMMNLPAVFTQYEEDSYHRIMSLIEQNASPLPALSIFLGLTHKLYKLKMICDF